MTDDQHQDERRPRLFTGDHSERPVNPTNMHIWACRCDSCDIYWDSTAGHAEYYAWIAHHGPPARRP